MITHFCCPYCHTVLKEQVATITLGSDKYQCTNCRTVFAIEYPGSATGTEFLVEVSNPKWHRDDDASN